MRLDQFDILRALIAQLGEQSAGVRDTVGLMRIEARDQSTVLKSEIKSLADRSDVLVAEIDVLKRSLIEVRDSHKKTWDAVQTHEVKIRQLEVTVLALQGEVETLRKVIAEDRAAVTRAIDEANAQRKTENEAIAAHVGRLEAAIVSANETRDGQMTKVVEAVSAVVDELGLEGKVELGSQLRPGEIPDRKLVKIQKQTKSTRTIQALTALGIILQAAYQIISNIHGH